MSSCRSYHLVPSYELHNMSIIGANYVLRRIIIHCARDPSLLPTPTARRHHLLRLHRPCSSHAQPHLWSADIAPPFSGRRVRQTDTTQMEPFERTFVVLSRALARRPNLDRALVLTSQPIICRVGPRQLRSWLTKASSDAEERRKTETYLAI